MMIISHLSFFIFATFHNKAHTKNFFIKTKSSDIKLFLDLEYLLQRQKKNLINDNPYLCSFKMSQKIIEKNFTKIG